MRVFLVLAAFAFTTGFAQAPSCTDEFAKGVAPESINSKYAANTQSVCYSEFALLVSKQTLTPLWAAEHLTREDVMAARKLKRVDRFHAEPSLPKGARAELTDYAKSGFDRGHMAPSGNMPTAIAQGESFSLANVAPQAPNMNRGVWEDIESDVRNLAVGMGELYVVTGPLFDVASAPKLNARIAIPAAYYKAVYNPRTGETGAYVAWNEEDARVTIVSIARLRGAVGFDPFPALPEAMKNKTMALPPARTS